VRAHRSSNGVWNRLLPPRRPRGHCRRRPSGLSLDHGACPGSFHCVAVHSRWSVAHPDPGCWHRPILCSAGGCGGAVAPVRAACASPRSHHCTMGSRRGLRPWMVCSQWREARKVPLSLGQETIRSQTSCDAGARVSGWQLWRVVDERIRSGCTTPTRGRRRDGGPALEEQRSAEYCGAPLPLGQRTDARGYV